MPLVDKPYSPESAPVLIIDDHPGDIELTRQVLKLSGHFKQIYSADSADEALNSYREFLADPKAHSWSSLPSLVFLDIWMPVKTGHEFLKEFGELRECHELNSVVVAMLSSSSAAMDREKSFEFEFVVDYLVKPLGMSDVDQVRSGADQFFKMSHKS